MNLEEAGAILGKIAALDNRNDSDVAVLAWHEVIGDLDYADALEAAAIHRRTSGEYLMPIHIRRIVEDIRRQRYHLELEADQRKALEAYAENAGPLTDRSDEIRSFVAGVRTGLPVGDPKALNPRKEQWRRDHIAYVRQRDGEPNPHYRGIAPEGGWPMPDTEVS